MMKQLLLRRRCLLWIPPSFSFRTSTGAEASVRVGGRHSPPTPSTQQQQQQQQRRGIASHRLIIEQPQPQRDPEREAYRQEILSHPSRIPFGSVVTDHMLQIEWHRTDKSSKSSSNNVGTWSDPKIVPYQNLSLSPAASCLHYGLQCFEGMKAYRSLESSSSTIRLFRPDMNMKRLSNSMQRLALPGFDFDPTALVECISELVRIEQDWIPHGFGTALYIRPTVIATHPYLGVTPPESILLYVICTPVGSYYASKEGNNSNAPTPTTTTSFSFPAVKLTADTVHVRAWPGGTGANKVGGNYAATMSAQATAQANGYDQVLWIKRHGPMWDAITEVGAMNIFFVLKQANGNKIELVTPPLIDGDILPGVTRDSVLHLARTHWSSNNNDNTEIVVSERYPTLTELYEASQNGTLLEAFGTGTAAVVTPIASIQYRDDQNVTREIRIPTTGPMTQRVWDEITGIQYGTRSGPTGWSVEI